MTRHFTSATYAFLKDLAANNDRDWFNDNKDRYLEKVQEPALEFITDFASHLAKLSPHFSADARVVGGSLFRIQRDTRFSKDKVPYKENTGVQFRHEAAGDAHAPGYYLHIQPSGSFMGVGLWRPETAVAYRIRERIAEDPAGWRRAAHGKAFTSAFSLEGDSLVNPPKGFDPHHPLVDDLKRKDFIATTTLSQKAVTSDGFIDEFARLAKTATPFMRFVCEAVDLPF
jgi:uncharacterized protein (TIGR02453 family)